MNRLLLYAMIVFILSGCVHNGYMSNVQPIFMVLKTEKLKYADSGFIRENSSHINIELFNASQAMLDLLIGKTICINKTCFSKSEFNRRFLGYAYDEELLYDIATYSPIYASKNLVKTADGFTQNISNDDMDISYTVTKKSLFFTDRKNKIIVKINKL